MSVEVVENLSNEVSLPPYVINDLSPIRTQSETIDWCMNTLQIPRIRAEFGLTGKGVKVAVIDSTPEYSPLIIKDNKDYISIVSISELYEKYAEKDVVITESGEYIKLCKDIQVYSGRSNGRNTKWQKVIHVLKHQYNGVIKKINTGSGVVDVTPNHSVISANGREIDAKDLLIGQNLAFSDTKFIRINSKGLFFQGNEDLAWLFGFFSAEGSVYKNKRGDGRISISQKGKEKLEKCVEILKKELNVHSKIVVSDSKIDMFKVICSNQNLYEFLVENLTHNGEKRVPNFIINSPKNIRVSYLNGYNDGDGSRWDDPKRNYTFKNFTTKSQLLGCGLCLLIDLTLDQTYSIYTRDDKKNIISIQLDQPNSEFNSDEINDENSLISNQKYLKNRKPNTIKKIIDINYNGWVYDLETEDHTFGCGCGQIRIHNTGCHIDHEDLKGAVISHHNVTNEPYAWSNGHGSGVASLIGARQNDLGIQSVAPNCQIIAIKALAESGSGSLTDIVKGIDLAVSLGANVINMSLGGNQGTPAMEQAIKNAINKGIHVICAAGNSGGDNTVGWPARYAETVAVGATNQNNQSSAFTSRGPEVDIAAPGERILVAWKNGGYATVSGTSFSSPLMAGCYALFVEAGIKVTHTMLRETAIDIEEPGFDHKSGFGLFNPYEIIKKYKASSTCAAINTTTASITNITDNSLTISWSGLLLAGIKYSISVYQGSTSVFVNKVVSSSSIDLTGLSPNSTYLVKIKTVCPNGSMSAESLIEVKTKDKVVSKIDLTDVKNVVGSLSSVISSLNSFIEKNK